jgi:hypothetical protein
MSEVTADKCNRCGKTVIKEMSISDTGMVQTEGVFTYLCSLKKRETSRPALTFEEDNSNFHHYCPDCLLATVQEWVTKIKKRGFTV